MVTVLCLFVFAFFFLMLEYMAITGVHWMEFIPFVKLFRESGE